MPRRSAGGDSWDDRWIHRDPGDDAVAPTRGGHQESAFGRLQSGKQRKKRIRPISTDAGTQLPAPDHQGVEILEANLRKETKHIGLPGCAGDRADPGRLRTVVRTKKIGVGNVYITAGAPNGVAKQAVQFHGQGNTACAMG